MAAGTTGRVESIEIPVKNSNEVIEVFLEDLPEDGEAISNVLVDEEAPLGLFGQFAVEYFHLNNGEAFLTLLRDGMDRFKALLAEDASLVNAKDACAMLGMHAAYLLMDFEREHNKESTEVVDLLNEAERLAQGISQRSINVDASITLRKALLFVMEKKYSQAEYQLRPLIGKDFPLAISVSVLSLYSVVLLMQGRFSDALQEMERLEVSYLDDVPRLRKDLLRLKAHCLHLMNQSMEAVQVFDLLDLSLLNLKDQVSFAVYQVNAAAFDSKDPSMLARGLQSLTKFYKMGLNQHDWWSATCICVVLAEHFIQKKDFVKAQLLTQQAMDSLQRSGGVVCDVYLDASVMSSTASAFKDNDSWDQCERQLVSDVLFLKARLAHIEDRIEEAFDGYRHVLLLTPLAIAAQIQLARIFVYRKDFKSAMMCVDTVFEAIKTDSTLKETLSGDVSFWTLAAGLLLNSNIRDNAARVVSYLEPFAASAADGDLMVHRLIVAARLEQLTSSGVQKKADRSAILDQLALSMAKLIDGNVEDLVTMHNYAIVLYRQGKMDESMALFEQLVSRASSEQLTNEICGSELSIQTLVYILRFNYARVMEDCGRNVKQAEGLYRDLLQDLKHESLDSVVDALDLECIIRLGVCARMDGRFGEASDYFKEAVGMDPTSVCAWTELALNHLAQRALTPARKTFERILKDIDRHDRLALLHLGHIHLLLDRKFANVKRPLEFFVKALSLQVSDVVAANNIGVCLAAMGRFSEAKDVLVQVRHCLDADQSKISHMISLRMQNAMALAHVHVELDQFLAATMLYRSVIDILGTSDSFSNSDAVGNSNSVGKEKREAQLCLVRCLYAHGKHLVASAKASSGHQSKMAVEVCSEALRVMDEELMTQSCGKDLPMRFNRLLLVLELVSALALDSLPSAYDLIQSDQVMPVIEELLALDQQSFGLKELLEARKKYVMSLTKTMASKIDRMRASDQTRADQLASVISQRQMVEEQMELEAQQLKQKQLEEELERERIRQELQAKVQDLEARVQSMPIKSSMSDDACGMKRSPRKRSAKVEFSDDEEDIENDDDDEVVMVKRPSRRSSGKPSALSVEFLSSSDEEVAPEELAALAPIDE